MTGNVGWITEGYPKKFLLGSTSQTRYKKGHTRSLPYRGAFRVHCKRRKIWLRRLLAYRLSWDLLNEEMYQRK